MIRDAHLLSAEQFSHLFWKIAKRMKFKSLTLTHRLDWDVAFRGNVWPWIKNLVGEPAKERPSSGPRLGTRATTPPPHHVCVVFTSALAAADEEPEVGDWAFSPGECTFGKIPHRSKGGVTLKLPGLISRPSRPLRILQVPPPRDGGRKARDHRRARPRVQAVRGLLPLPNQGPVRVRGEHPSSNANSTPAARRSSPWEPSSPWPGKRRFLFGRRSNSSSRTTRRIGTSNRRRTR